MVGSKGGLPCQVYFSFLPVNLWVILGEPGISEYDLVLSSKTNHQEGFFGILVVYTDIKGYLVVNKTCCYADCVIKDLSSSAHSSIL